MPGYIVTGKLGGGKTLMSVARMYDYLSRGRPVATNIDFIPRSLFPKSKKLRITRLPDVPKIEHLESLGRAYNIHHTYDDEKNGLIVLDECGYWFNARNYTDPNRKPVIDWFLHSRKLGWDFIFIVQDVSMMDKQARIALGEHTVYCRRTDRLGIPFISPLIKLFLGERVSLPKIHFGVVKYGLAFNAPKVDTWTCRAKKFYNSYDTRQIFGIQDKSFCYIPPGNITYSPKTKKNRVYYMRITKIYLKKFSRIAIFGVALCLSTLLNVLVSRYYSSQQPVRVAEETETVTELNQAPPPEKCEYQKISYFRQGDSVTILTGNGLVKLSNYTFPIKSYGNDLYACLPIEEPDQYTSEASM